MAPTEEDAKQQPRRACYRGLSGESDENDLEKAISMRFHKPQGASFAAEAPLSLLNLLGMM